MFDETEQDDLGFPIEDDEAYAEMWHNEQEYPF